MNHERGLLIAAIGSLFILLTIGTVLFKHLEGWSTIDAFYFTGITMATIGYGDVVPKTSAGKVAAVVFAFLSVGIALYALNLIARMAFRQNLESIEWLKRKSKSEPLTKPYSSQSASEQDRPNK